MKWLHQIDISLHLQAGRSTPMAERPSSPWTGAGCDPMTSNICMPYAGALINWPSCSSYHYNKQSGWSIRCFLTYMSREITLKKLGNSQWHYTNCYQSLPEAMTASHNDSSFKTLILNLTVLRITRGLAMSVFWKSFTLVVWFWGMKLAQRSCILTCDQMTFCVRDCLMIR